MPGVVVIVVYGCVALVRKQAFLRPAGITAWPDGTTAARYGFQHAIQQQLWHEHSSITQQQRWHQRIGTRLEHAYNGRAGEIAAELAVHFEEGRDYPKAIQYLQQATEAALRRHAHHEVISYLSKSHILLATLPDTQDRIEQELNCLAVLGPVLSMVRGFADPDVEQVFARQRPLPAR
jgi:predicted ATPase